MWSGSIVISPSVVGRLTPSAISSRISFSGVIIFSFSFLAMIFKVCLSFFATLIRTSVLHRTSHIKFIFRFAVVLAVQDFFEGPDGFRKRHILPFCSGELLGHEERLGEEFLDFSGSIHKLLVSLG